MENQTHRLPFTPFEQYLWEDDCPGYPAVFYLRLELSVGLDSEKLQRAVHSVKSAHPLLFATVERCRSKLNWHLGTTAPQVSQHTSDHYSDSKSTWSFDLMSESGVRLSIGNLNSGSEVWLQVHHCCSDARGILDFLADVLNSYPSPNEPSCSTTCTAGTLPPVSQQLSRRGLGGSRRLRGYFYPASKQWKRILAYYRHRTRPYFPDRTAAEAEPLVRGPACISRSVYLRKRTRDSQVMRRAGDNEGDVEKPTINDHVLAAVLGCMGQGMIERNQTSQKPVWMRVGVSIDQRRSHGACTTAANRSSLVFVDRSTEDICREELLEGLANEMQEVKAHHLSSVFIDVLAAFVAVPGAMGAATRDRRQAVTAVLSNLGALDACLKPRTSSDLPTDGCDGSTCVTNDQQKHLLEATAIDFLAPLRPGTQASFGVVTYLDKLHFCLHYDPKCLDACEAESLLDSVVNRFTASLSKSPRYQVKSGPDPQ